MQLRPSPPHKRQHGFTLVELMIASTIGLLILASMTALFVNNSRAQAEIEKASRQVENGRFAVQLMTGDLRNAGYFGELDMSVKVPTATAALPDPCAVTLSALGDAIQIPVQGYNNVAANVLACLSDYAVKSGTDVVVVRHTATCEVGVGNCEPASAGGPFFQASLCNNSSELNSGVATDAYAIAATATDAALSRHKRDCNTTAGSGTAAPIRRLETHIYFVASNDNGSDGIPTLKRAELSTTGSVIAMKIVPLVEGIDNLQIQYSTGAGVYVDASAVADWSAIAAVKLNVLARNTDLTINYTNTNTYTLGSESIAAANDHYKRHAFQTTVGLPNRL